MTDHQTARPLALVTGGTRGIGRAIAIRFAEGDFDVLITARSSGSWNEFRDGLPSEVEPARFSFWAVDFAQVDSARAFYGHVEGLPGLAALVNNAGTNINNPLPDIRDEDLDYLDDVNLRAPIRVMRAAIAPMRRAGGGRIVNIASIWSIVTRADRLAYTASKFGLVGATKTAAVDLADDGILVNAVSPGFTMTELTRRTVNAEDESMLAGRVPLGRFAEPSEIAGLVYFLCGPENSYITGQNVAVDGGYTVV